MNQIKKLTKKDCGRCSIIINNCINNLHELNFKAKKIIKDKTKPAEIYKELSNNYTITYKINGTVQGLRSLRNNKIRRVYVNPTIQNKGIGSKIMKHLEKKAIKENIKKIKIESSLEAKPFYEKLGYKTKKESLIKKGNAEFKFIKMEKNLIEI